jgi:hypothetical protein
MVRRSMKNMKDKTNLLMPNGNVISIGEDTEYDKIRDSLIANQIN